VSPKPTPSTRLETVRRLSDAPTAGSVCLVMRLRQRSPTNYNLHLDCSMAHASAAHSIAVYSESGVTVPRNHCTQVGATSTSISSTTPGAPTTSCGSEKTSASASSSAHPDPIPFRISRRSPSRAFCSLFPNPCSLAPDPCSLIPDPCSLIARPLFCYH
jgi:hypothetical protein